MVRIEGLEPPWISPLEPKSSASANFAISAIKARLPISLAALRLRVSSYLFELPPGCAGVVLIYSDSPYPRRAHYTPIILVFKNSLETGDLFRHILFE